MRPLPRLAMIAMLALSVAPTARGAEDHTVLTMLTKFVPGNFDNPEQIRHIQIPRGDTITLRNLDTPGSVDHNLEHINQPLKPKLFKSAFISPGESAAVAGVSTLAKGAYPFRCLNHPSLMHGTLTIT